MPNAALALACCAALVGDPLADKVAAILARAAGSIRYTSGGPGEVLGGGKPDWPADLQTFAERRAYQRGVADARRMAAGEDST